MNVKFLSWSKTHLKFGLFKDGQSTFRLILMLINVVFHRNLLYFVKFVPSLSLEGISRLCKVCSNQQRRSKVDRPLPNIFKFCFTASDWRIDRVYNDLTDCITFKILQIRIFGIFEHFSDDIIDTDVTRSQKIAINTLMTCESRRHEPKTILNQLEYGI